MGLALIMMPVQSFDISAAGTKWPGARTTFFTGVRGESPSGVPWSVAMAQAANEWSEKTAFTFDINPGYRDPCAGRGPGQRPDYVNGADFRSTVCGRAFTGTTLAVAVYFTEFNILGSADIVEADIIFNSNLSFDVYDGPQRPGSQGTIFDFRRIALHELGHVLGLGHEDTQPAIMASRIGNLFRLQPDDINGANTLYSGLANCDNRPISFGWTFGSLQEGDCRIRELMAGGTDNSFVDVYRLELADDMTVTFDMLGDGRLDGVMLLSDNRLGVLAIDENSAGNCNPRITRQLAAGSYALLINTYSNATALSCGGTNTGNYRISMIHESPELLTLTGKQSFQGGQSNAKFFGGVTRNGGQTYVNKVRPTEAFDVEGRIEIDPVHQGQPGYMVVAAIVDKGAETLVKNINGEFVLYQPEQLLVPIYRKKVLGAVEDIDVMTQMVAASIGISSIEVEFLIGYGVDSDPDELYFHSQPISLIVE